MNLQLKELRHERGKTQDDIAAVCGVKIFSVHKFTKVHKKQKKTPRRNSARGHDGRDTLSDAT